MSSQSQEFTAIVLENVHDVTRRTSQDWCDSFRMVPHDALVVSYLPMFSVPVISVVINQFHRVITNSARDECHRAVAEPPTAENDTGDRDFSEENTHQRLRYLPDVCRISGTAIERFSSRRPHKSINQVRVMEVSRSARSNIRFRRSAHL